MGLLHVAMLDFALMRIFCHTAPPRIDRGRLRSEYVVKEGDELVLPCPATGSPDPRLAFTRSEVDPTTQSIVERPLGEESSSSPSLLPTSDKDSLSRRTVISQASSLFLNEIGCMATLSTSPFFCRSVKL